MKLYRLIVALCFVAILVIGFNIFIKSAEKIQTYGYQFGASSKYYVFAHDVSPRSRVLVTFDSQKGKLQLLKHASDFLSSPKFYSENKMFASILPQLNTGRHSLQEEINSIESTLVSCELDALRCTPIFNFNGSITDAIALQNDDILFVGGAPKVVADPFAPDRLFVSYRDANFYVRTKANKTKQHTTVDAPQINSVSRSNETLVFEYHPKLLRPSSEKKHTSKIYSAAVQSDTTELSVRINENEPFVTFGEIDVKPSISPDGIHIAFRSVLGGRGSRWVYEIVLYDLRQRKLVAKISPEEEGEGPLSMPIFVSNEKVRYVSYKDGVYYLKEYSLMTERSTLSGKVHVSDINLNDAIEISSN